MFDTTDKEHRDFTTLFLRVRKAADGECKITAFMALAEK
jgi:hypothetical protein